MLNLVSQIDIKDNFVNNLKMHHFPMDWHVVELVENHSLEADLEGQYFQLTKSGPLLRSFEETSAVYIIRSFVNFLTKELNDGFHVLNATEQAHASFENTSSAISNYFNNLENFHMLTSIYPNYLVPHNLAKNPFGSFISSAVERHESSNSLESEASSFDRVIDRSWFFNIDLMEKRRLDLLSIIKRNEKMEGSFSFRKRRR